jgi:hypothetical protein
MWARAAAMLITTVVILGLTGDRRTKPITEGSR